MGVLKHYYIRINLLGNNFHGLLLLSFHLFLSAFGAAGVLCRTEEAAPPHADNLQLHLLRLGESVVLHADTVQYERGLHERPPDEKNIKKNTCNSINCGVYYYITL